MGKITTLMLLMAGMDALFYYTGLTSLDTGNTTLTYLLSPSAIIVVGLTSVAIVGGAALISTLGSFLSGLFTGTSSSISLGNVVSNLRYAYVIPFVAAILKMLGDGFILWSKVDSISPVFAVLFISPLFIVASLSIYALWDSGITV